VGWDPPRILETDTTALEPGMCLAIEAMAGRDGLGSALFEQNVIITVDGVELLTTLPVCDW
jgi:Xaa-Pro aminopeptidase